MTVKITQPEKAAGKPTSVGANVYAELKGLGGHLINVENERSGLTAKLQVLNDVRKGYLGRVEVLVSDLHEDATVLVDFDQGIMKIGAEGITRTFKDEGKGLMREFLGDDAFFELISVPLGAVDDYLTKPQREKVLDIIRNGSRSIGVKAKDD